MANPAQSPGRGEIKKPSSDAIVRRIHKKRRRAQKFDRQLMLGRQDLLDDSDDEDTPSPIEAEHKKPPVEEGRLLAGFFTYIHNHPDLPSIIAKYLQLLFNGAILLGCLYMIWSFYGAIQADVDRASEETMAEVLTEMAQCTKNYVENRCGADTRLPALEIVCSNWELCMNRDPKCSEASKSERAHICRDLQQLRGTHQLESYGFHHHHDRSGLGGQQCHVFLVSATARTVC